MSTLEKAIALATKKHAGQLDKAGQPYILHPLRLMLNV
ncbi:MAG TPA: guanosine-3',5'-bis(diphosphate) 3'-pyrophosphohydrolase, partial [Acinetobacter ursingii]|nr:guanosine-3',5'-bis(diphosphate) 3'-pyrophosphohydrolase [Acinetobacter ursingii]